jgi:hypothetical protein
VKLQSIIFYLLLAYVAEEFLESVRVRIALPEQIKITSRAMGLSAPELEQHGPLQNELLAVTRLREAVEESLQAVSGENDTEIFVLFSCLVHQPLANRSGHITRAVLSHVTASR